MPLERCVEAFLSIGREGIEAIARAEGRPL